MACDVSPVAMFNNDVEVDITNITNNNNEDSNKKCSWC